MKKEKEIVGVVGGAQKETPKEKEKIADVEHLTASVRAYFTKDVNDQITAMGPKEMNALMKELITTRYWIALVKYTSMRVPVLDTMLRSLNPYVEPHRISWAQGVLAGLSDIESRVIELNSQKPEDIPASESEQVRSEGVVGNS